jgi:hypothetical protein
MKTILVAEKTTETISVPLDNNNRGITILSQATQVRIVHLK